MPFFGVLPERIALFQPQPEADVAVNDVHAWRLNPQHRFIYNKLDLALAQGLKAAPCGVAPELYGLAKDQPVFVKPIVNLAGMSLGARAQTAGSVDAEAGSFWCELLTGEQTSTDCIMDNGKVVWFLHTQAAKQRNQQRPIYWRVGVNLGHLEAFIRTFLETQLSGYTGLCNLEMIDAKVIEVHLRGSNGFFDFYGPTFINSWVRLMDEQVWVAPEPSSGGVVYSVFSDKVIGLNEWAELRQQLDQQYPDMTIQTDRQVIDRLAIIRGPCFHSAEKIAFIIQAHLS